MKHRRDTDECSGPDRLGHQRLLPTGGRHLAALVATGHEEGRAGHEPPGAVAAFQPCPGRCFESITQMPEGTTAMWSMLVRRRGTARSCSTTPRPPTA